MVSRVRNEVEIHSRLKHPAILELYNYFEDSNYVYLVLEVCHNGELNRYLHTVNRRFTEEEGIVTQTVSVYTCVETHSLLPLDFRKVKGNVSIYVQGPNLERLLK